MDGLAAMSHQIDLHEARLSVIPLGEGADRDGVLEQGARLGGAQPMRLAALADPFEQAIHRCWADSQQLLTGCVIQRQLAEAF